MTTLRARLASWWFEEAPAERLAMVRVLLAAFSLWYLGDRVALFADIARTDPALFAPAGVARLLSGPLPPAWIDLLVWITLGLNVALLVGWRHRVTGPAFAIALMALLCYRNSWSMIYHSDNLLVFHALILGCSPAADAVALRTKTSAVASWRYGWPVRLIGLTTVLTYALAGIAKLAGPLGLQWATGEAMRSQVLADAVRKDLLGADVAALVPYLSEAVGLFGLLAAGSLILEIGAPAAMLHRRAGVVWALATWSMHWGIWVVMGITFRYHMAGLPFLPFFPLERVVYWVRTFKAPASPQPQLERTT